MGVSPEQAPDKPTYITLHFEKGVPTMVDGKELKPVEMLEYLNKVGGENGVGLCDLVENRLVGMKSRGVYETPGGAILRRVLRRTQGRPRVQAHLPSNEGSRRPCSSELGG